MADREREAPRTEESEKVTKHGGTAPAAGDQSLPGTPPPPPGPGGSPSTTGGITTGPQE